MSSDKADTKIPEKGYLLEDFRLFHNTDTLGTDVGVHFHDFYKVTFVKYGSGSYMIDGRIYDVTTGDIILVGRGVPHRPSFAPGNLYDRYTLYISVKMLEDFDIPECHIRDLFSSESANVIRPEMKETDSFAGVLERIDREKRSSSYASHLAARLGVIRFLIEAGRCREESALTVPLSAAEEDDMLRLLRYVNDNISKVMSVDDIAEHFKTEPSNLDEDFRTAFGCQLAEYMKNRRLTRAHEMIMDGQDPAEACYSCGYGSYKDFADSYEDKYGVPPKRPVKIEAEKDIFTDYFPE